MKVGDWVKYKGEHVVLVGIMVNVTTATEVWIAPRLQLAGESEADYKKLWKGPLRMCDVTKVQP